MRKNDGIWKREINASDLSICLNFSPRIPHIANNAIWAVARTFAALDVTTALLKLVEKEVF